MEVGNYFNDGIVIYGYNEGFLLQKSLELIFQSFNLLNIKDYQNVSCYYFLKAIKSSEGCITDVNVLGSIIFTSIDITLKISLDQDFSLYKSIPDILLWIKSKSNFNLWRDFELSKISLITYSYLFIDFISNINEEILCNVDTLQKMEMASRVFCNPYFILFKKETLNYIVEGKDIESLENMFVRNYWLNYLKFNK